MPGTNDITNQIISGDKVFRHTDGTFYIDEGDGGVSNLYSNYVRDIVEFLNLICREFGSYYQSMNYEDLFFIVNQIYECEVREYENPIVQFYIDHVRPGVEKNHPSSERNLENLRELTYETKNYIRDLTWRSLHTEPLTLDQFSIVKNSLDKDLKVNVFTLNHDTLVEQYLYSNDISYCDGFDDIQNDVRFWNNSFSQSSNDEVNLIKLHGSIDWFRLRNDSGNYHDEQIGIPLVIDYWHTKTKDKEYRTPPEGRPEFLIGTFNKILQYTNEIFFDLNYQFVNNLRTTNRLVVSGYGFGDKAINYQIVKWMYDNPENKMYVIHRNPDSLKINSRGSIGRNWSQWSDNGQLITIKKHIDELKSDDIDFCITI